MKAEKTLLGRSYAQYNQDRKYILSSNAALSVVLVILVFLLWSRDEVIVMVPPQLEAEAKIINGEGNEEYHKL